MIGIYKITSPKKRVYIGQSIDIETRFKQYKNIKYCKGQIRLYNSFKKHGVHNHKFEIILECEINELNEKERYYQEIYNVLGKKGLNCVLVNTKEKKLIHSKETLKKISKKNIGSKRSQEFKEKMRLKMLSISEETRKKMSDSAKKKNRTKEQYIKVSNSKKNKPQKRYNVLNIESGVFHESIPVAAKTYGYDYGYLKAALLGQFKNKTNLIYIKKK